MTSMQTTTDTKKTITHLDGANSQLQMLFFNILFLFASHEQEAASTLVKICTGGRDPLLLSPLLKHTTHSPTVLPSTVWSPYTFSKHQWVPILLFFFSWRNIMTYLSFMSMSDTILSNSRVLSFNLSNCLICWSFLQSWISQKQSEKQSSRVNYYVLKAWAYAQTLLFSKVDPWVFGTPDASASHSLSLNISLCITKQAYSVF